MPHFGDAGWSNLSGLEFQVNATFSNTTATGATLYTYTVPTIVNQITLTNSPYKYTTFYRATYYARVASADSGGTSPTVSFSIEYTNPASGATSVITTQSLSVSTNDNTNQMSYVFPVLPGGTIVLKRSSGGTVGGTPATVMLDYALEAI
jgi:hypothetical protein